MRHRVCLLCAGFLALALGGCQQPQPEDVMMYSSRSKSMAAPLIERFVQETGISVSVRYGTAEELISALGEEQAEADLFWAQEAGTLTRLQQDTLLAPLPDSILSQVPAALRSDAGTWVVTSGRAYTLAYAPARADTTALPQRLVDLADSTYTDRVGWAPADSSFQRVVTAMRATAGADSTRAWLKAMANNAQSYADSRSIVRALVNGEIDYGLPTRDVFFRAVRPIDSLRQALFTAGDPGNIMSWTGLGVLRNSDQRERALHFISHLLAPKAQQYVADETREYPVIKELASDSVQAAVNRLRNAQPDIAADTLRDQERTRQLLREVGLL